jgi:hypothetical protein
MAVWFKRWLQRAKTLQIADGIAIKIGRDSIKRLLGQQFTQARPATGHRRPKGANTKDMIVETTCCTRESACMR